MQESDVLLPKTEKNEGGVKRVRSPAQPQLIIAVATLIFFLNLRSFSTSSTSSIPVSFSGGSNRDKSASGSYDSIYVNNSYGGQVHSVLRGFYNWTVVEPFRVTTLTLQQKAKNANGGVWSTVVWTVILGGARGGTGGSVVEFRENSSTCFEYVFKKAGRPYTITASSALTGENVSVDLLCKYVRREMRQLHDEDAERYKIALATVYTTELEKGRKLYGSEFKSGHWFTRWHLGSKSKYSPFHGAPSFLTVHTYLGSQFERSLQSVDPQVALHYWDVSADSGSSWANTFFWDENWFGPLDGKKPGNLHGLSGRFENVTIMRNLTAGRKHYDFSFNATHNSYGLVTEPYNNNPSLLVTRTPTFCGSSTKNYSIPGCYVLRGCFQAENMIDLHSCIESDLHSDIHQILGGFYDCGVDLKEEGYLNYSHEIVTFGTCLPTLAKTSYYGGLKSLDFNFTVPKYCSLDTPFEDCRLEEPNVLAALTNNDTTPIVLFNMFYKLADCCTDLSDLLEDSAEYESIIFKNRTLSETREIIRLVLRIWAQLPKFSQFSSPLGSANDPIFWPIHVSYEKIWNYMRLRPGSFNSSWGNSLETGEKVRGWNFDDEVMPCDDAYGIRRRPIGTYFTNREMVELFDPSRPELPYIFDDFGYSQCQL